MKADVWTDGGSRGNPGPSAWAFYARCTLVGGLVMTHRAAGVLPGNATNNEAEYAGVLHAAAWLYEMGVTDATIHSDSSLVVGQVSLNWRVKAAHLVPLRDAVVRTLAKLPKWRMVQVPREENVEADRLVNFALDGGTVA